MFVRLQVNFNRADWMSLIKFCRLWEKIITMRWCVTNFVRFFEKISSIKFKIVVLGNFIKQVGTGAAYLK